MLGMKGGVMFFKRQSPPSEHNKKDRKIVVALPKNTKRLSMPKLMNMEVEASSEEESYVSDSSYEEDVSEEGSNSDSEDDFVLKTPVSTPKNQKRKNAVASTFLLTPVATRPLATEKKGKPDNAKPTSFNGVLPCRENQTNQLMNILFSAMKEGHGTCIYLSGVPGTGKTATVRQVIDYLVSQRDAKLLPYFETAEINGLKLKNFNEAYCILYEKLNMNKNRSFNLSHSAALQKCEKLICSKNHMPCLIVMDELDQLFNSSQNSLLYNFFDWPNRPGSKLVVVAIANTMDLPERLLQSKLASRLNMNRLNFLPYQLNELITIIKSRVEDSLYSFSSLPFHPDAIELCARKVGNVSGDCRRALDICRRALEISLANNQQLVSIEHMQNAIQEIYSSPMVQMIQRLPLYQLLLLISFKNLSKRTGCQMLESFKIFEELNLISKILNYSPVSTNDFAFMLYNLCECKLVLHKDKFNFQFDFIDKFDWNAAFHINMFDDELETGVCRSSHANLAATGSGKTLAYVLPVLEILLRKYKSNASAFVKSSDVHALVIAPTRELAIQIFEAFNIFINDSFYKKTVLSAVLLIGGHSKKGSSDIGSSLSAASIVIGTPGRIFELMSKGTHSLKEFEVLVMDEADRLLEMGQGAKLNEIIAFLPKQRRTALFSATLVGSGSELMKDLVRAGLRNPVKVTVSVDCSNEEGPNSSVIPESLKVFGILVRPEDKFEKLVEFLLLNSKRKTIVYFATCACVDYFFKILSKLKYLKKDQPKLFSLHGKMVQKKRLALFSSYLEASNGCLFCTDVAARGLDFPNIDITLQYDPPNDPKSFVHRIGRSARAGRNGLALVYLQDNEDAYFHFLKNRKIPIEEIKSQQEILNCSDEIGAIALDKSVLYNEMMQLNRRDRDCFQKGNLAFISYIRSYKEHQASFLFRLKDLDINSLIKAYGLVQIPKMPELKDFTIEPLPRIDVNSIKFEDKKREKQRKLTLSKSLVEPKAAVKKKPIYTESWSNQKRKKNTKQPKKNQLVFLNEEESHSKEMEIDIDELNNDYRLYKKEKKIRGNGANDLPE